MKRGLRHMTEKLLPGTTLDLKTDRHTNKMLYQCILSQTYNATRLWHVFRILMLRKTVYPTYDGQQSPMNKWGTKVLAFYIGMGHGARI